MTRCSNNNENVYIIRRLLILIQLVKKVILYPTKCLKEIKRLMFGLLRGVLGIATLPCSKGPGFKSRWNPQFLNHFPLKKNRFYRHPILKFSVKNFTDVYKKKKRKASSSRIQSTINSSCSFYVYCSSRFCK